MLSLPGTILVICPSCKQIDFLDAYKECLEINSAYSRNNGDVYHRQCRKPCRFFALGKIKKGGTK